MITMTEQEKETAKIFHMQGWNDALEEIARQFRKQVPVENLTPEAKEFAEFVLRLLWLSTVQEDEPMLQPARQNWEEREGYLKSNLFVEGLNPFPEKGDEKLAKK